MTQACVLLLAPVDRLQRTVFFFRSQYVDCFGKLCFIDCILNLAHQLACRF